MIEFIKKYSVDTDIFVFQEVFHDALVIRAVVKNARPKLFSELQNVLSDFNGYFAAPLEKDVGGLAIFIKKSFMVHKVENLVLFKEINSTTNEQDPNYFSMGRNLQRLEFIRSGKTYTILNFHGMWIYKSKIDTEKRLLQSEKVKKIFAESNGAKILCTDLNVTPEVF